MPTTVTNTLQIPAHDGGGFSAYIAIPKGLEDGKAPVVILIQEIFGVNKEMRDKCDALAEQGYIAVCPDLFWRIEPNIQLVDSVPEQLERAFQLFGEFNIAEGIEDLKSVLSFMRVHELSNGKVGCIGYCLGGKLAYMMSTCSDIDASVGYYGVMIDTMLDQAKNITKPLMLHIAENDEFVSRESQEKIKEALRDHPHVTIHSYAGQDHAFARGNGMHYNEEAATLANGRTAEFLEKALR